MPNLVPTCCTFPEGFVQEARETVRRRTAIAGRCLSDQKALKTSGRIQVKHLLTSLVIVALIGSAVVGQTPTTLKLNRSPEAKPVSQLALAPVPRQQDKPKKPSEEGWQDVLKLVDPDKHTIGQGIWRVRDGKIVAYPAPHSSRLRIPIVPTDAYEIRAKWEPKQNGCSAIFILPHGQQTASIEFDDRLRCCGLGDLNGVRPDVNETKKPLKIKPGKTYDVYVRLSWSDKQIHVEAKLDGETMVDWEGKRSEVHHEYFSPPKPYSLGLAVGGQVSVFHSMELRMTKGKAELWKPARGSSSTAR